MTLKNARRPGRRARPPLGREGLLGPAGARARRDVRSRFPNEFALAQDIFRLAWALPLTDVRSSKQRALAALLFIKIRNDYQALIKLVELGLCIQAETILRGFLEALVRLSLLCTDEAFVEEYEAGESIHRSRFIRSGARGEYPGLEEGDVEWARDQLERLEAELADGGTKREARIHELFERAGWKGAYECHYRSLCASAHTNLHAIDRYLGQNEDGETFPLVGPIGDGIPYALSVAMHWLLETMRQLARLFTDLELGEDFCALERRLSEQSQSYREAFAGVLE